MPVDILKGAKPADLPVVQASVQTGGDRRRIKALNPRLLSDRS